MPKHLEPREIRAKFLALAPLAEAALRKRTKSRPISDEENEQYETELTALLARIEPDYDEEHDEILAEQTKSFGKTALIELIKRGSPIHGPEMRFQILDILSKGKSVGEPKGPKKSLSTHKYIESMRWLLWIIWTKGKSVARQPSSFGIKSKSHAILVCSLLLDESESKIRNETNNLSLKKGPTSNFLDCDRKIVYMPHIDSGKELILRVARENQ